MLTEPRDDMLVAFSRRVYMLAVLTLPMLALRVKGTVTVSDILFALSAITLLFSIEKPMRPSLPAVVFVSALLVVLGGSLAALRSNAPYSDLAVVGRLLFLIVVWPWQTRALLATRNQRSWALSLFALGAALSGLAGILEARNGISILGSVVTTGDRAPGLTQQVNDQGGLLAAAVPIIIGLLLARQRRTLLGLVALVCCLGGLVYSGSVSGMIGAVIGSTFLVLRYGIRLRVVVVVLAIGVAALAVIGSQTTTSLSPVQRFEQATGHGNLPAINNTYSSRLATDKYAWHQIKQDPFVGRGLDSASAVTVDYLQTHDFFLLTWYQGGLLTLIGLLAFFIAAWRRRGDRHDLQAASLTGSLVAVLAFSVAAPVLYERYFWLGAVFLIAGLAERPRAVEAEPMETWDWVSAADRYKAMAH